MLLGGVYDFTMQMFIQFYSLLNAHVSILDSMKVNENIIEFEHILTCMRSRGATANKVMQ